MSKLDVTTRELFMRLGSTSQKRSARADAVFRRLRIEKQDKLFDALSGAPRKLNASDLDNGRGAGGNDRKKPQPKTVL